jgi:predicted aspartyl protease
MYVLKKAYINLFIGLLLLFLATTKAYCKAEVISHFPEEKPQLISLMELKAMDLFLAGHYLMVECQLNGKVAYFMIDTGASYTVLNSKSAKLYDFQVLERKGQQTTGFGGNQELVQIAIGANIRLGDHLISMAFLTQDLSKIIRLVQDNSKVRMVGIIGTDLLQRYGYKLNIATKTLSIENNP